MTTYVIVDGNNLAHYLYPLGSGKPVPPEVDALLISTLTDWALRQSREVLVEFCLDPRSAPPGGSDCVSVLVVDPGKKADGLIVVRVAFHIYTGDTCFVVTSDEELTHQVEEYKVGCLAAHEFVTSTRSARPAFVSLPTTIPQGVLPPISPQESGPSQRPTKARHKARRIKTFSPVDEYEQLVGRTLAGQKNSTFSKETPGPGPGSNDIPTGEAEPKTQTVRLTLQSWPAKAGANFLKESFCPEHLREIQPLLERPSGLQADDLPALADFLLEHCGAEADFIQRGGCLMDRVRLALLRSEGMRLPVTGLTVLTGDRLSDIKHKLRQGNERWIKIEG